MTAKPASKSLPERFRKSMRKYWQLFAMLVVPLTFVFIFNYLVYPNLRIAFMNFRPARGWNSDWVGFDIFKMVFNDADFYRALRNTVVFNIADIILHFPAPIILALMLNELRFSKYKRISQTILYLPHFLSAIIIASIAYTLLKPETGLVNVALRDAGLIERGIPFLTDR